MISVLAYHGFIWFYHGYFNLFKKKPWDSSQPWGPRVRGQHPGTVGDHGGPLAGADGNDFGESNHQNQN
jgi:hypothetical protein